MSIGAKRTESLVSLQYPNGRRCDAAVTGGDRLRAGDEFDLHGRHWRAVEYVRQTRYGPGTARILCTSLGRTAPVSD